MTSAALSAVVQHALDRRPPAVAGWVRSNYAGRPVSLTGGAAAAVACVAAGSGFAPVERRRAYAIAVLAAALAGAYDDLLAPRWERSQDKGARGHLRALRSGRPSGGVVKVAVIGAGALSAAPAPTALVRRCTDAALVAGAANVVNLFDLRPGRAAKVTAAVGVALLAGPARGGAASARSVAGVRRAGAVAGVAVGAAAAALRADLGERHLLGDIGANPLGALLGLALAERGGRLRAGALVVILGLTGASEWVSFSRIIDSVGVLRALDRLGRR